MDMSKFKDRRSYFRKAGVKVVSKGATRNVVLALGNTGFYEYIHVPAFGNMIMFVTYSVYVMLFAGARIAPVS